jgi:outer membrane protein TolC
VNRLLLLGVSLIIIIPHVVGAQTDSLINIHELIEEARENNPGLRELRADYEAAESRISWFSHIPDPVVAVEFSDVMTMYSVTQQVPFPTKISKRREFMQDDAAYHFLQYLDKEQAVILQVKMVYAELMLLHAKIKATERSIAFMEQIYNITQQKYSINEAPQSEVLMSQVQLAKMENQVILLRDDLVIAQARLNSILNRDLEAIFPIPIKPAETVDTLPLVTLYALAEQNDPQLRALLYRQEAADARLSIARQSYLPDLSFRYTYEDRKDAMQNTKYMFGLSVPLWFLDKQNNAVQESAAKVRSVSARVNKLKNDIRFGVKQAKTKVNKYRQMVDLFNNSVLPQAEAALKSALSAYQYDKLDFVVLLASERTLVQTEYDYEEARANLFIAWAELEEIVGPLE